VSRRHASSPSRASSNSNLSFPLSLTRDLDISTDVVGKAPEPVLGVGVRQGGNLVSDNLNVSPGTPLQMEIFLDRKSAPVYGLGVNYMQVSDTRNQEETIIFNG
jgi:hypothetical protein